MRTSADATGACTAAAALRLRLIARGSARLGLTLVMLFAAGVFGMEECAVAHAAQVEGEVLVKFRADTPPARIEEIHREIGGRVLQVWSGIGWQRIALPAGVSASAGVQAYRHYPEVEAAEPNYVHRIPPQTETQPRVP